MAEPTGPTVTQRITRDFGRELLAAQDDVPLAAHGTALRLLEDHHDVLRIPGGHVGGIDGREHDSVSEDETLWVMNVNGIEADTPPADYRLSPGDVVQWDLRDWYGTLDVRATVGAFPQTFTRGVFGKRFPVTVECAAPTSDACRRVKRVLHEAGVATGGPARRSGRPRPGMPQRARVLVGSWEHWRDRPWPQRIDEGPRYSGVFARFTPASDELRLLDWNTRPIRTEGAGTGLVAAMRPTEEDLLWLVTGTDDRGVERAARALDPRELRDAFAVAIVEDGVEKLPLPPR